MNIVDNIVDVRSEKNLCAWGLVASILSYFIPFPGILFSILGLIAYTVGILKLSKKLNPDILKNFIFSVFLFIGGLIVSYAIYFLLAVWFSRVSNSPNLSISLLLIIPEFFVLYIGAVASAFFSKKYLEIIYEETGSRTFDLAAKVVFWGTIALLFFSILGWMIVIVAFFNLPDYIEKNNQTIVLS